ncbi:unnamed protein product [Cuscuta campestris]|uniref:DEAD/DEAH box helicase domain-containing protein n=2 Tax=Cuscuta sect. Cleistogrammica TaxID=1824901 RepID=A0A484LDZ5_9ASTE|nr:hypothetical protein DM860_009447 [Cuscuta australis]VFQ74557.1 unnamed protein product [Cuscuta campestris]
MPIHKQNVGGLADSTLANADEEQNPMVLYFKDELKESKRPFKLQNAEILSVSKEKQDAYDDYDGAPSKRLLLCLSIIEDDKAFINERNGRFFANYWGFEFWKSYTKGKDIVDTSQSESTLVQIAWIASTASDIIIGKGNQLSPSSPFLIYLVPSQREVIKVFQVCKPLITSGILTLCQDHVLTSTPDIFVSTPKRLKELISCKAIDVSMVSFLVIDGPRYDGDSVEAIKTIKNLMLSSSQTMVFGGCLIDPSPSAS